MRRVLMTWVVLACGCSPDDARRRLPEVTPTGTYHRHSTTQRDSATPYAFVDPDNKDFNRFVAVCGTAPLPLMAELDDDAPCSLSDNGLLLVRQDGPGVLSRLWLTGAIVLLPPTWNDEGLLIIRDGVTVLRASLQELVKRGSGPFTEPWAGPSSGAWSSHVPIAFEHSLRIVLTHPEASKSYFFIADTQQGHGLAATPLSEATRELLAAVSPRRGTLIAGTPTSEGLELRVDRGATIESLTMVLASASDANLQLELDGQRTVDVSLAGLMTYTREPFTSAFLSSTVVGDEHTVTLSLPIAFHQRAHVWLRGPGIKRLQATTTSAPSTHTGRLHAVETHTIAGEKMATLLQRQARGKIVGVTFAMRGHQTTDAYLVHSPWNFLETDDVLELDRVVHHGTGTEDYFGGGFYFRSGPFQRALQGVTATAVNQESAQFSGYRWHAPFDTLPYGQSASWAWEMTIANEALVDAIDAVVWFYED